MNTKAFKERQVPQTVPEVAYNLLGQRLGRKGLETRERILTAALRLIESSKEMITLSGVAREVSVGMTTLYLYFPDIGDLILACLKRVMESADAAFMDRLRTRWPDESLRACSFDFLQAHHQFWLRHARILHLCNSFADGGDARFLKYRNNASKPLLAALILQMDGVAADLFSPTGHLAIVLLITLERLATIITKPLFQTQVRDYGVLDETRYVENFMNAEAEVMAVTIRHQRNAKKPCLLMHEFSC